MLGVSLVLVALGGCAKKGTGDEPSPAPPRSKADKCKQIGKEVGRMVAVAGGTLAVGLSDDPASAKDALGEIGPVAGDAAKELEAACLGWSDKAVNCLSDPTVMLFDSEGCERAVSEAFGNPMPPDDVPTGPTPKWTHTFEGTPSELRLRDDGSLVARFDDYQPGEGDEDGTWYRALVGVRDGTQVWERTGDFGDTILDLGESGFVVVAGDAVEAFEPRTGAIRWTWMPPAPRIEAWESPATRPVPRGIAFDGQQILVVDSDARFFGLDTTGEHVTQLHQLRDETIDDAKLMVGNDGTRWLWESYDLRAFDSQWEQTVGLRAHELLSAVSVRGDQVVLNIDDEIMGIAPDACRSADVVAPSNWPRSGGLEKPSVVALAKGEDDECQDCASPPPGCVLWSHDLEDAAPETIALAAGAAIVNDGRQTFALAEQVKWTAATAAGGRAAVGRFVYALFPGDDESGHAQLWALEPATGKHVWQSTLPHGNDGWLYSTDDVHVEAEGGWVVAGYGATVSAFRP